MPTMTPEDQEAIARGLETLAKFIPDNHIQAQLLVDGLATCSAFADLIAGDQQGHEVDYVHDRVRNALPGDEDDMPTEEPTDVGL